MAVKLLGRTPANDDVVGDDAPQGVCQHGHLPTVSLKIRIPLCKHVVQPIHFSRQALDYLKQEISCTNDTYYENVVSSISLVTLSSLLLQWCLEQKDRSTAHPILLLIVHWYSLHTG